MRTIELPVTTEWTPETLESLPRDYRYEVCEGRLIVAAAAMRPAEYQEAVIHQHRLVREEGGARYAETRVVTLTELEKESL